MIWTHHSHGSRECKCGWPVHTTLTRTADATATADAYGLHGLGALHYYACSALLIQLSRFLPSSPHTPRPQFQAARRNVCLARSSPIKGHTLPTGPPMYQATEWMDCRGAQGVSPDDLNPTAWGQLVGTLEAGIETI